MAKAKPAMKRAPKKKAVDLEKLQAFADAAELNSNNVEEPSNEPEKTLAAKEPKIPQGTAINNDKTLFPWEKEGVSEKIPKPFNIRTNQVQIEKLKYIVENVPGYKSVHAFCMDAIEKRMEDEIDRLTN